MTFTADLTRFAEKAKGNMDLVVRKVTMDIARGVVMKTPVDTGRARGSYVFGVSAIPTELPDAIDPGGQTTVSRLVSQIGRTKAGGVTYIASNLPYIERLEHGWSAQAPSGMVRLTVVEFQQYVKNATQGLA